MTTWTAPATEIATAYRPAYPFLPDRAATWDDTTCLLTGTAPARARLAELDADLVLNGQEEPVRVDPGGCDPDDDECTGAPDCCPPRVLDGTHRLVAALLAGWDVTVTDEPHPGGPGQALTATDLVLRGADDGTTGAVFDQLSFRTDQGVWMTTSFMASERAGEDVTTTIYWDADATGSEDQVARRLAQVVASTGAELVSVRSYPVLDQE